MKFCKFEEHGGLCKLFDDYCSLGVCTAERLIEVVPVDNEEEEMCDNVNHPAHYTQGGVECIDAIEAAMSELSGIEAVCTGNAIKYLWRWRKKNGIEDLKKALWYIDRLIDFTGANDGEPHYD